MQNQTINSFPSIGEEKNLPIFMRAVGRNEYQLEVVQEEGYIYHQIYFLEKGELELTICEDTLRIKKRMGFFIPRDIPYRIHVLTSDCTTHWVSFGCRYEEDFLPMLGLEQYKIFPELNIKELGLQLKKMYLLSTENTFYSRCQNSALVYQFIMDVYAQDQKRLQSIEEESENPALLLAKRYIEQFYFNELSLEVIADFAHVSPQHLCRLFQKHMKMRPTNYINLTRIKVSKWLLHGSNKTIAEIAEEVGYNSPYYYTNTFKKYENMSPSAYRKMVQN